VLIKKYLYIKNTIFVQMFIFYRRILVFRLLRLIFLIFPAIASAQTSQEVRLMFSQAEAYYLYGDFELANPLYLTIAAYEPDNYNILYKIGECYLNIPDEKSKAIEFLEKAVKNSNYDAKSDVLKEKRAPLDSYFLLGKAYMVNNQLEKAIATFQTFEKLVGETKQKGGMQNAEFIKQQILACNNAITLEAAPIQLSKTKLPPDFSMGSIDDNPAVSFDGNTIAYTERRGVSNAIYFSKKERGRWQPPIEITNEINAGEDCSTCSLNNDGTELFLYKKDNEDGNIYSSVYVNGAWSPIKKLNKNINTKFYESHAGISADGKKLYFSSNRDGGQGQLDIYVSEKDATGEWGPAVNLGASINTPFNEDNPFITRNDSVLYFSSEGHSSIGGFDIFKSLKLGNVWKTPQNLGYPINTTDDDKFFQPINNGINAYYSMSTDYKKKEIFYLGIGVSAVKQRFEIKGTFSLIDTAVYFDKNFNIHLLDYSSGDTLDVGYPNKYSGLYNFVVNPGSFKILYSGAGYLTQTIDTAILEDNPSLTIILDVKLIKDPNYIAVAVKPAILQDTARKVNEPLIYEKIDLALIPTITRVDSSMLVLNMNVNDVTDKNVNDADVLYYTVQVMALHNPVDISYFKYITDMKVLFNDQDKFYRYTTGRYSTREEASTRRLELIRKGYPEEIFIKKVSKQ
jgi:tetratricopeptide (TPR) repeat protein